MQREISTNTPTQIPPMVELSLKGRMVTPVAPVVPQSTPMPTMSDDVPDGLYPMRAVVQLTGLKAETIRAWQRRYGAVIPRRSQGNARCFTMEDVRRLALLKEATSLGHAISEIARLDEDQLLKIVQANSPVMVEAPEDGKSSEQKVFDHQ